MKNLLKTPSEEIGLWLYTAIVTILPLVVAIYTAGTYAREAYDRIVERVDALFLLLGMTPHTTRYQTNA